MTEALRALPANTQNARNVFGTSSYLSSVQGMDRGHILSLSLLKCLLGLQVVLILEAVIGCLGI